MRDPAVDFIKLKKRYLKISAAYHDKKFPEYSWISEPTDPIPDFEDHLELRLRAVYMTEKEFNELKEFAGP